MEQIVCCVCGYTTADIDERMLLLPSGNVVCCYECMAEYFQAKLKTIRELQERKN